MAEEQARRRWLPPPAAGEGRPRWAAWRRLPWWTDASRLRWWTEVALVAGFYFVYSWISDQTSGARSIAFAHARATITAERWLGIYHEQTIQRFFLGDRGVIKAADLYYVSLHFILPTVALFYLFFKARPHYIRWRNALAWTTGISMVWFMVDPVMPPRLLPASYGFVDTLNVVGGAGRFDAALMKDAGNLFAAMPSLHLAWAAWCACALVPLVRRWWVKALLVAHLLATIFVVTVTANHFFMDLIGGAVALGLGIALSAVRWGAVGRVVAGLVTRWRRHPEGAGERQAALGSIGPGAGETAVAAPGEAVTAATSSGRGGSDA
ncbi:MAG: phosphatase PAP2 family protein [Acidimicrobiales bacterium]|nr:phosphatase PAP2 family protein [Acidimicrobiales bacterium]